MSSQSYADQINRQTREREIAGFAGLIQNIGGMYGDTKRRDFQSNITNLFTDEGVSPETLQKARSMYPNVDPKELLGTASAVDTQKKAQTMKDIGKTISSIVMNSQGELNIQQVLQQVLKDKPEMGEHIMGNPTVMQALAQLIKLTQQEKKKKSFQGFGLNQNVYDEEGTIVQHGKAEAPKKDTLVMNVVTGRPEMHDKETAANMINSGEATVYEKPTKAGRLYATESGYVTEEEAIGKKPYRSPEKADKPEKPKTPEQMRNDKVKVNAEILKNIELLKNADDKDEQDIIIDTLKTLGVDVEVNEESGWTITSPFDSYNTKKRTVKIKNKSTAQTTGKKPPAGYKDTGRTMGGKKVYSDGKNAWVE